MNFFDFWHKERAPESESSSASENIAEPISPRVLLATMMSSLREGVIVVGEDLRVLDSNPAARRIFAGVAPPLENRRLTDLTRNLAVHTAFEAALQRGELSDVQVESRGDVDKQTFDLRVAPLQFEREPDARSAIGIFYDITRLERLEKVRQEFLSNVSHELRTPLTAILAFVETLEDGAINDFDNNVRFVGVIRKNAERMHRLINDILELSAIESGTIKVEPVNIRLQPFVADVIADLSAKAVAKNVSLVNEVASDATVFADAVRLEQMLTNLIDNAIKFNRDAGSVCVRFEANERRALVSVSDTGEGILHDHAARIFERFYRVDRARSTAARDTGGTGLGLAIVKHLARLHGGEASVVSTLGAGSTFTIELPLKTAE